jgi:serine/threonine protein kinase
MTIITTYTKGETKTRDLIPTDKQCLGQGAFGEVFGHGKNPELVVKKSSVSMVHDFEIASAIDHPNVVKVHNLFIKQYPNGKTKYKLVMDKINAPQLYRCQQINLPSKTILQLMKQAKDCCLYLFDHNILWQDVHGGNTYYDSKKKQLIVADFGLWKKSLFPVIQMRTYIKEASQVLTNILLMSSTPEIRMLQHDIYLEAKATPSSPSLLECLKPDISSKMRGVISQYFDQIMQTVEDAATREAPLQFG